MRPGDTQRRIGGADWGIIGELRVRLGLNAGEAELHAGDYFGPPVNCTARVMSAAWGGQVLLAPAVTSVSPLPRDASFRGMFPEPLAFGVTAAAWSPDGSRVVTFSEDRLGRIWDTATGDLLLTFTAPSGVDPDVGWSRSGDRIIAGGMSGAAIAWDATTENELLTIDVGVPFGASWSPDGLRIAIADFNGNLTIYPAWQTLHDLVAYAKECCVIRELPWEERNQFGLDPR